MPASHLDPYLNLEDHNGDLVSSWAEQVGPGKCKCTVCGGPSIDFRMGKCSFMRHSQTAKHQQNIKNLKGPKKQQNIQDAFAGAASKDKDVDKVNRQIKKFEIDLTRRLVCHYVPLGVVDCLTNCMKTHLAEDSKIVAGMKLSSSKAEYLEKAIADTYQEETVKKLHKCDAFSVGMDESTINKEHECEVMVKLSTKDNGIELVHYKTIALEGTGAEVQTNTLLEEFDDDKIDYRKKCIAPMTDGCAVMQGSISGVKVRLAKKIPELHDFGSEMSPGLNLSTFY